MASPLLTDERFCQGFFSGAYLLLGVVSFFSKIMMPVFVAGSEGSIWLTYVTWDLWWLIYLYIGWRLQYPSKRVWTLSILAAFFDFLISAGRMILFVRTSLWTVWSASRFVNNLLSFGLSLLFFFYLFSHSTRQAFGVKTSGAPAGQ